MAYEMMDANQIGNKLKELRESQNMTIESLASALHISSSAVCMYETGKRIPRDEIKIRYAEYFHSKLESIFFPENQHES